MSMSIIRTIDLTKKFDNFVANDAINLTVEPQEIKCIVGENGAGKSTLTSSRCSSRALWTPWPTASAWFISISSWSPA